MQRVCLANEKVIFIDFLPEKRYDIKQFLLNGEILIFRMYLLLAYKFSLFIGVEVERNKAGKSRRFLKCQNLGIIYFIDRTVVT